jgi:hypothetical protein
MTTTVQLVRLCRWRSCWAIAIEADTSGHDERSVSADHASDLGL